MDENYIKNLENIIKQMLTPLRNVPLSLVIESICGHKIIPFNPDDEKDQALLKGLIDVAKLAGTNINKRGISRPRPNEVGNDIEVYVMDALKMHEYYAYTPKTKSGMKKAMGYPDIEFIDKNKRINYLECKTYNKENILTTQRSFYLSPSEDFKITIDAHHFILSFEVYVSGRDGNNNVFKCKEWKILSLENLLVDVKYEFQSDNARLYSNEMIIAHGEIT